jgi:UrcA family protein
MNTLLKVAAFAVSLGALGGHSAFAEEASAAVNSVPVFYGDLDVTKKPGAALFVSRIKAAADQACGGRPDIRELAAMSRYKACVKDATDGAMASRAGVLSLAAVNGQTIREVASAR